MRTDRMELGAADAAAAAEAMPPFAEAAALLDPTAVAAEDASPLSVGPEYARCLG